MKKINWSDVDAAKKGIPQDAYVVRIEKVTDDDKNDRLTFLYEIAEGDYKDFYAEETRDFVHSFSQKYSDRSQYYFAALLKAFEESNRGFNIEEWQQDCDPQALAGLEVGILLEKVLRTGDTGNDYEFTRVNSVLPVQDVRKGRYTLPPDVDERVKLEAELAEDDDDLPFYES